MLIHVPHRPGINFVIGVNGSGKSTIGCAIAATFACTEPIAHRVPDGKVGNLVNKYCTNRVSSSEIVISGGEGMPDVTIKRTIKAVDGESVFSMDGGSS